MAPGVAATRLEKLHFTNWLNWNCELTQNVRPSQSVVPTCMSSG